MNGINTRKTIRMILYGTWAAGSVFLVKTVGMTAETWKQLDWFQLLLLALAMNSSVLAIIIAYLDDPNAQPKPTT